MDFQNLKWKTALALLVIYLAVFMNWSWVWGVLFIMWTIPALYSGHTHFVEPIDRETDPVFFWLIVGTWIALSIFIIAFDLSKLF